MEKCLDLTGMETTTHLEIVKKLIDEMTMTEKKILINYLKATMKHPQTPVNPVNHTVTFAFK